jgi:hypothetical protein
MTEEEEERVNAVKEALKLTPEERAVVIIKKDKKTFCLGLNISNFGILQLIGSGLVGSIHDVLIENKSPLDQHLLALEILFKDLKENYKRTYLNKSEIEPDTSKQ